MRTEVPIMSVGPQILCYCGRCLARAHHEVVSISLSLETGYEPDVVIRFRCSKCRRLFEQTYKMVGRKPVDSKNKRRET